MQTTPGLVVTFYSFKGGVGRSMALANIAILLGRAGKKVLCIDWDLEAPGLDRYLCAADQAGLKRPAVSPPHLKGGLLDVLLLSTAHKLAVWRNYVRTRVGVDGTKVDFLTSGEDAEAYSSRLAAFSWVDFFARHHGHEVIEGLRNEWKDQYDFVLVDSRTGLTDASGVCTIMMPDLLLLLFASNSQNIDWCERVAKAIRAGRQSLPYDRLFLPIIPVLSRLDSQELPDRAAAAMDEVASRFGPYYAEWLPASVTARAMVQWARLPYMPTYGFEEILAVEHERFPSPDGLWYYYDLFSRLILVHFQKVRPILADFHVPGAYLEPLLPALDELEPAILRDPLLIARYQSAIVARAKEEPEDAVIAGEKLARACAAISRFAEAEAVLSAVIEICKEPWTGLRHRGPGLLVLLAELLARAPRFSESASRHQEAIALAISVFGTASIDTAEVRRRYARLLAENGQTSEALEQFRLAVVACETAPPPSNTGVLLASLIEWRDLLGEQERWAEMEPLARRVADIMAAEEPLRLSECTMAEDLLGTALFRLGRWDESVKHQRRALHYDSKAIEAGMEASALTAALHNNLGRVLIETQAYKEAEHHLREALSLDRKLQTPGPERVTHGSNLGILLCAAGRYMEAEPWLRGALEENSRTYGRDHGEVAIDLINLARCLSKAHKTDEADACWIEGLTLMAKHFGERHYRTGISRWHYAKHLSRAGRDSEVEPIMKDALVALQESLPADHPELVRALTRPLS